MSRNRIRRTRNVYLVRVTDKDLQGNSHLVPYLTVVFNKRGDWIKEYWEIVKLLPTLVGAPGGYEVFPRKIIYILGRQPYSPQWG